MINISDLSLNFSGEPLFKDVNLKFTQGNCYGVIGANGAGKSTFLRILSGDLDPSTGTVSIAPKTRMSVLKQDHFAFNEETVLNTVLGGNERLLEVMREKDALYMKDPFTEEDDPFLNHISVLVNNLESCTRQLLIRSNITL